MPYLITFLPLISLLPLFIALQSCERPSSEKVINSKETLTVVRPSNRKYLRLGDLSSEQQEKIAQLKTTLYRGIAPQLATERQQKNALEEAIKSATATDEELQKLFEQLQSTRKQASDLRFQHLLEVRKILTPEQRAQAAGPMLIRFATPPRVNRQEGLLNIDSEK